MATVVSPSPDSSPSADPPTSNPSPPSPPSASSPSDSSTTESPLTTAQPDQTSDPPTPSAPSPQSDPLTPPPSPLPESSASPPPLPPASPPPSPPASPPPPPPAATPPSSPASPPPSSPAATPPASPPPPDVTPPPPSDSSPPAPSGGSPPPQPSPTPPSASPPPPQDASPSPPPPTNVPAPLSPTHPPPPVVKAPENSPPPTIAPPSDSQSSPPLPSNSSSTPTLAAQPPTVPSSSAPPPNSLPAPLSNSSSIPTAPPLPSIPTEKPIATNGTGLTENAASIGNQGLSTGGAVAIGVVVSFVLLSFVVMAAWFVQKRKKRAAGSKPGYTTPSPFSSQNSDAVFLRARSPVPLIGSGSGTDFMYSSSEMSNSRSWFTYQDLVEATNGFSAQYLLGEGGFGCVYKGVLTDGRKVAVKQLKIGGGQGEREFRAEVEIIGRVHHRHLVSLVGYCISDHQRLLVYDYVPNDTLHHHLHGQNKLVLDWATRVKIAAGAARGIAYLHEDCHPRIIHRDIKSSNILLDSNFEAQVSDFGLAKLALDTCTHVSTRVMGTFGYMAPEYATSGKLTEKSDVYSYGVVLLELITGRKPVDDSQPMGDESLVEWARPLLAQALDNGGFEGLVDPTLEKNYVDTELFRMIEAAAACVRHSATKRPRMSQVVRALDSVGESSDLSNGMKLGQSEIYDSAQQSAQIKMFRRMAFGSQNYNSSYFDGSQSSWESREHDI